MVEALNAVAAPAMLPESGPERTNAMIHFYRGEMGRMNSWRGRIDQTSNWAITVVAALLSVSLSTPTAHHGVLLFAVLLVSLLLLVEARRYRFFDVYRNRVRLYEQNYFAPILSPTEAGDPNWGKILAQSLREPVFGVTMLEAISRRLWRNYIWMYLILLLAWVLKIWSPELEVEERASGRIAYVLEIIGHASLGPVPGWAVIGAMAVFYTALAWAILSAPRAPWVRHGGVRV